MSFRPTLRRLSAIALLTPLGASIGCGIGIEPLMPTPVIYTESGFEPLEHIPENERWIPRRIFYATVRERDTDLQRIDYANTPSESVSVGMALVGFGGPDLTWSSLEDISTRPDRPEVVNLTIAGIMEKGRFDPADQPSVSGGPHAAGFMLQSMREVIQTARDKDVLIYVHGAKVNFYNACAFAAQLDHFMGRDMTSVAFSWPTHQNIVSYVFGDDLRRSYDSGPALAALIDLIASETEAEKIHVLSWSAGARVAMTGIAALHDRYPHESPEQLRERFRLGTVYFAAGDAPADEFLAHIDDIHALADQLVISQTDHDQALDASTSFIGGTNRIGQEGIDLTPDEQRHISALERLEIVDVSIGAEERGFDITGHRYWFNHPWASSDVLLSIRTRLAPDERGLQRGDHAPLWYLPADYPNRLRRLLTDTELGAWSNFHEHHSTR